MSDGGKLTWQVGGRPGKGGVTKCGNVQLGGGTQAASVAADGTDAFPDHVDAHVGLLGVGSPRRRVLSAVNVTTYGWVYEW